jgi:hypothetical protein
MHLVSMDTLLILLSLGPGYHHPRGQDITHTPEPPGKGVAHTVVVDIVPSMRKSPLSSVSTLKCLMTHWVCFRCGYQG